MAFTWAGVRERHPVGELVVGQGGLLATREQTNICRTFQINGSIGRIEPMAEVVLYHHVQGLTDGMQSFADELRAAGHTVHTPDLFDGRTFDTIEEGMAFAARWVSARCSSVG